MRREEKLKVKVGERTKKRTGKKRAPPCVPLSKKRKKK